MPRNGSGTYSLPQPPFVPNTTIASAAVNSDFSDIATALTGSVSADGQTPITGALQSGQTSGPGYASTVDKTTGFGVSAAGVANIWASGVQVLTATSSGISIEGTFALTELAISTGQAGVSVSVTNASPGVVTWTAHGFSANQPVFFTAAAMPGGLNSEQIYFVVSASITTNTFEVSIAPNGSALNTTSTGTTVLGFTPALTATGGVSAVDGLTVDNLFATNATITNLTAGGLPVPTPQGYLTPVSNTPIITGDSVSATVIYYTPFVGSYAAIHNGTIIIPYNFSQMSLTLNTSQAANNIYDIFLVYNSNSPVIGTGPTWAASGGSVTAGSCARGGGSGSTAIQRSSTTGLWVNTNSMSLIYNTGSGNVTITVPAGQGIYLGSIYIDATAGQVSCYRSWGQSRKWGIWNAYNRSPLSIQAGDSTSSWLYSTNTYRPSNNNTANSFTTFTGLPEEIIGISFSQLIGQEANASTFVEGTAFIGIGWNSTTSISGRVGTFTTQGISMLANGALFSVEQAEYKASPLLGINTVTALESFLQSNQAIGTFSGSNANMILVANWRG